jgi:hypothetical protein
MISSAIIPQPLARLPGGRSSRVSASACSGLINLYSQPAVDRAWAAPGLAPFFFLRRHRISNVRESFIKQVTAPSSS